MSPRQYKKKAKAARDILIERYGFKASDFWTPPKNSRAEHEVCTGEDVYGKEYGSIIIPNGCPVHLPEFVDYWGEANDPTCCIFLLRETIFWAVCGEAYARKSLAA